MKKIFEVLCGWIQTSVTRKRSVANQSSREGACNRTGDANVTFYEEGGAAAWARSDFSKEKSEQALYRLLRRGWAGGIRTCGMPESKSGALPLGDSPKDPNMKKRRYAFFHIRCGVDNRNRTDDLQGHNLAL